MQSELTAEAVLEAKKFADFNFTQGGHEVKWHAQRGWWLSCDEREASLSKDEALALITDAMKREMGGDWYGVSRPYSAPRWRAVVGGFAVDGDTESEAVVKAYAAWKEGK
jgi:hypothetical protein